MVRTLVMPIQADRRRRRPQIPTSTSQTQYQRSISQVSHQPRQRYLQVLTITTNLLPSPPPSFLTASSTSGAHFIPTVVPAIWLCIALLPPTYPPAPLPPPRAAS